MSGDSGPSPPEFDREPGEEPGTWREHRGNPDGVDLLDALNHSMRRRILRLLADGEARSSGEIRRRLENPKSGPLNYHLAVLLKCGAISRLKKAGELQHYYTATPATEASWFRAALRESAGEDQG